MRKTQPSTRERSLVGALSLGGSLFVLAPQAMASGGHWMVDDAAVFPKGTPAIEGWHEDFGDSASATTLQPAYTFRNGVEITGVIESFSPNGSSEEVFGLEAKGLWYDFEGGDDFGLGWVVGTAFDDDADLEEIFVYVPYSQPIGDAGMLFHANVGWEQDRTGPDNEDNFFFGAGSEIPVGGPASAIVEVLGNSDDDTFAQAGARFELGASPGLLDLSYGQNLDESDDDWITIGFAWEFGG